MRIIPSNNGLTFETVGLRERYGYEVIATVSDPELATECSKFVRFVVDYICGGAILRSDETLQYGYWLTKAVVDDNLRLVFCEYDLPAIEFIPGLNNTLSFWKSQHERCDRAGARFLPPRPDQMIVISEGVLEGEGVYGVRYPSPAHMSGWWMTTKRYDGNIKSLQKVHAFHVTSKREDLGKYIALPHGYRFNSNDGSVWFDQKVATAAP